MMPDFNQLRDELLRYKKLRVQLYRRIGGLFPGTGEWSEQHLIAVIDSMTAEERKRPTLLREASRADRVAIGAGVSADLISLMLSLHDVVAQPHTATRSDVSKDLCENFHAKHVAGCCPWCGAMIAS